MARGDPGRSKCLAGGGRKRDSCASAAGLGLGVSPRSHGHTYGHACMVRTLFTEAYLKVAEEYEIPAMVLDFENPVVVQGFKEAGYPINDEMVDLVNAYSLPKLDFFASAPNADSYAEKKASFQALVRSLQPGLTEIIFHPSELTDNLKSITNSWQQRAWEAEMFEDEEMIEFFKAEKIVFTNWKEIMKRFKAG